MQEKQADANKDGTPATDDDGNTNTAPNDDDGDWYLEEVEFSDASSKSITEANSLSRNDGIRDTGGFDRQEDDAQAFGFAHDTCCP